MALQRKTKVGVPFTPKALQANNAPIQSTNISLRKTSRTSLLEPPLKILILFVLAQIEFSLGQHLVRVVDRALWLLRGLDDGGDNTRTASARKRLGTFVFRERNAHAFVEGSGSHAGAGIKSSAHRACRNVGIAIGEVNGDDGRVVDVVHIASDNSLGELGIDVF